MDVGDWLKSLGLAQYEAAFRDNAIDGEVLPKLTVDDLKDLGVAIVGHRRKILSAIEALSAAPAAPATPAAGPGPAPADAAERRQLTVMFADLVGSTALSARLDPEDMRHIIRAYQDACSGVVARYDGFIAKFMGDGVLAYFGFPRAHEDDAARAVHAGLEIAEAVAALQTRAREKLAVRVGIATGLVVVGDIVGQGPAQEQAVVGDTPNLAARLQGLAEPGGVVLAASTRRLIGLRFRLKDLGRQAVKGLAEPVETYAALGVSASESRFDAAHAARLSGFVGREAESAELLARQRRAWEGHGQIVLISGEAGIGKSRLSAWLAEQVAETPHTRLRYQCSPYHRDSALYPFVQQFERAAAIAPQEPPEAKLEKLEKVLGLATRAMNEVAPLIAAMLSIPTGARYPPLNLSPAQQRRQTLSALLDQMEGLAKQQPVLMLFEDAHWADATSLEVLDLAIERVRRLPALFIVTSRPEFEAPWKGLPDVAEIALERFDRAEAEALVERVTGGRKLPAEVLAQIVAKTDGVPLFVEELTKNVLESGLLIEDGEAYRLNGPLPPLAIPSTLQDSLMARLDRLATVKEIAQIGAAIGREFSYPLLNAVVGRDEPILRAALTQLEESELVFRHGAPPGVRYTFKHALVQDTAYESLLRSRRQILHRKIAETLRDQFADVAEAEPELLAHHFTQADLTQPAIEYWGKAGDLALRRSAFKEAIAHLGKAIEMTEALAGQKEQADGKLKLQVALGNALMTVRGQGAPEAQAAFERARVTASAVENAPERLVVTYGLYAGAYLRGELSPMREHAAAFLRGVAARPNSPEAGVAHRANGVTAWCAGNFADARRHLEQALAIFNPNRDSDLAFSFSHDPGVAAMAYLALTLWPLGEIDRARQLVADMMRRTTEITHVGTICFANMHAGYLEMMRGDPIRTEPFANALARLARDHDLKMWTAFGVFLEGWATWQAGARDAGLAGMRDGVSQLAEQGVVVFDGLIKTKLAQVEADDGAIVAALTIIDEAVAVSERTGHGWYDAEIRRTRGEILLKQNPDNPARAEEAFLTAIAIAQSQKARSFELRAARALAKLYNATGRPADARDVLGPALEGFAPTSEFPEISEAQALFDALLESEEVSAAIAARKHRLQMQLALGNALMAARGYGAKETTAAFESARTLAASIAEAPERFAVLHGLWSGSYVRGEFGPMQELADAFLREVEAQPHSPEAGVAHRGMGLTHLFAGEFREARVQLDQALVNFDPERDGDFAFRFGLDPGVAGMAHLSLTLWPLGEFDQARRNFSNFTARSASITHLGTIAFASLQAAFFELIRRDNERAAPHAMTFARLARENDMAMWQAFGIFFEGWTAWRTGDRDAGISEMRRGVAQLDAHKIVAHAGSVKFLLAEAEAEAGEIEAGVATIDNAVAECRRIGHRRFEAEIHRTRAEILLKRNPADPVPAEESFLAAIAIARSQKARSFELRAALALTKLYRATGRDADAHALLGPALEGFAPTPEFPEIAEARALFDALAQTDAVRTATASRVRQVALQIALGNALIATRGHGAPETTAAFARARDLARDVNDNATQASITYGLWVGSYTRGELEPMLELAAAFLRDTASSPDSAEAAVAERINGVTRWFQGDFVRARAHFERALAIFDRIQDRELAFRFGQDQLVANEIVLALVLWPLGEVDEAGRLARAAQRLAEECGQVSTLAYLHMWAGAYEILRDDAVRAALHIDALEALSREHDLAFFAELGSFFRGWLQWRTGDGKEWIRDGLATFRDLLSGARARLAVMDVAFARGEAQIGGLAAALAILDDILANNARIGQRWLDAEHYRARGELLAEADPAAAEQAFLAAIAIAQAQKTRSFELRAALALAKLYRATGRDAEAHAALGPALEGFAPTPEFPEIAEAKAVMAQSPGVKSLR